ncbi:MAG: aminotransferase class III-fold pyridoxal phosphate-dependent enzyme [Gemmatimonadaceae bacterium]
MNADRFVDGEPDAPFSASDIGVTWRDRALAAIPGGTSTGSKRPTALFGARGGDVPAHFVHASGCDVESADGSSFLDCTMALGSVALGYADEGVTRAVMAAVADGHVAGFAHLSEVELAERLCEVIPCAEQVRFLKTGAEAVAAAVRIARVHTGRSHVVGSGYFGWLDWCNRSDGIPAAVTSDYTAIPFDDVVALETVIAEHRDRLAAVVLEPVVHRMPSLEWIAAARRLCDQWGAVLIFDEIKTGFRLRTGGFQESVGVAPDLATFGKALANGFPLAAVVGRRAVMESAQRTWISSTLAGEATALAAAHAVLDRHAEEDVCGQLAAIGAAMRTGVSRAVAASRLPGIYLDGIDPMWFLRFEDDALHDAFLHHAFQRGVLLKRGAYNFAALAHGPDVAARLEALTSNALVDAREELERER